MLILIPDNIIIHELKNTLKEESYAGFAFEERDNIWSGKLEEIGSFTGSQPYAHRA